MFAAGTVSTRWAQVQTLLAQLWFIVDLFFASLHTPCVLYENGLASQLNEPNSILFNPTEKRDQSIKLVQIN